MTERTSYHLQILDPMRGLAILLVLALHLAEPGTGSGDSLIHGHLWPVLQHGYLGVQLFFVVSGYCMVAALYKTFGRPGGLRGFLERRARRIFPPYWASLVLVVLMGGATIALLGTSADVVFPLRGWEWLANVALLQGPLQAENANMVYWSLSIELQFYLVMAVTLLFGERWTESWLVVVSLVALLANTTHALGGSDWILRYWHEFACGIAAFYWITGSNRWRVTPYALLLIALASANASVLEHGAATLPDGVFIPGVKVLFSVGVGLVLVGLSHFDQRLMTMPLAKVLARVGLMSYSLYLTHVPVATRVFNLGRRVTGLEGLWWFVYFGLALVITLSFGWFFFRVCERPWLNSPARLVRDTPPA